jgi:hypothetical protein
VVSAVAEATDWDQLQAYGAVIGAIADKLDGAAARAAANAVVERVVPAIAEATIPKQTQAYAAAIAAVAHKVDGAAANAVAERVVSAIAGTKIPSQLQAYAAAIVSVQVNLRREEWLFAATEILKHPLAALGDTDGILAKAIGNAIGWPARTEPSLWACVFELTNREPWLPLARRPQSAETVIAEFHHLLEHGPPLPEVETASA